jgi:flagellar hook assembly protein FlgD
MPGSIEVPSHYRPSSQVQSNAKQQDLGKDTFLKLMMIQMQHQDPLNPMDNSAMLSQMAQFSSLEQMSKINKNLQSQHAMDAFMDATRLIGKEVAVRDVSSDPSNPSFNQEVVRSVSFTPNGPVLTLNNGDIALVDQIVRVSEPSKQGDGA